MKEIKVDHNLSTQMAADKADFNIVSDFAASALTFPCRFVGLFAWSSLLV